MLYKFGTDALFGNCSTSVPADINYFQEAFNLTAAYAVVAVPYAWRGETIISSQGYSPKPQQRQCTLTCWMRLQAEETLENSSPNTEGVLYRKQCFTFQNNLKVGLWMMVQ